MHGAGHPNWYSGITQRDEMGKEVGGEFRMVGHMYTHG